MSSDSSSSCPMPHAHKRLMDCHAQWHAVQESYFDPDGFRLALNSFLQTHRSVTSLLLKHKANLPGFQEWFTAYSDTTAKLQVMRWAKNSRNRIVHESDLDLHSSCHVTWIGDWRTRSELRGTFPPRMSVREILTAIKASRGIPPFGTITIARRWIDKELEHWELLDAAAAVYMHLNELLRVGHQASDIETCNLQGPNHECVSAELPLTSGYLPCMHIAQSELTSHFSAPDGSVLSDVSHEFEVDEAKAQEAAKDYQLPDFPDGDAIARVPGMMRVARQVMEKDGYHGTFAFLFAGESVLQIQAMEFDSQRTKQLSFERLARLVDSSRADGVLIIGEMWTGVQTELEKKLNTVLIPARDRVDKTESLAVYAVTRDGRRTEQVCAVTRGQHGETHCSEPVQSDLGIMNTMIPIFRAWKEMELRGL
ncbi:hypothetical protein [Streptomyces caniscabiei]|uniref:hypothetical protein n=1 Tax=Streptomyces caniscabiei TaxID=2746961 RepID=UPI000A95F71D|nr:hypothetical protein [Streptomyces caniscabiei]